MSGGTSSRVRQRLSTYGNVRRRETCERGFKFYCTQNPRAPSITCVSAAEVEQHSVFYRLPISLVLTQIEFFKECGDDNVCDAELRVDWLYVSGVVVGSQSARAQVNASLTVTNAGETAYAVTLNVTFPRPSLQFAAAAPEHLVCHQPLDTFSHLFMLTNWPTVHKSALSTTFKKSLLR